MQLSVAVVAAMAAASAAETEAKQVAIVPFETVGGVWSSMMNCPPILAELPQSLVKVNSTVKVFVLPQLFATTGVPFVMLIMVPEPRDVRVAVFRVGAPVVLDRAKLAWAESGDPAWADVIQLVETWPKPVMPLTGADLVARGFAPGPAIGEALRRAEAAWIASDFTLTADELLRLA